MPTTVCALRYLPPCIDSRMCPPTFARMYPQPYVPFDIYPHVPTVVRGLRYSAAYTDSRMYPPTFARMHRQPWVSPDIRLQPPMTIYTLPYLSARTDDGLVPPVFFRTYRWPRPLPVLPYMPSDICPHAREVSHVSRRLSACTDDLAHSPIFVRMCRAPHMPSELNPQAPTTRLPRLIRLRQGPLYTFHLCVCMRCQSCRVSDSYPPAPSTLEEFRCPPACDADLASPKIPVGMRRLPRMRSGIYPCRPPCIRSDTHPHVPTLAYALGCRRSRTLPVTDRNHLPPPTGRDDLRWPTTFVYVRPYLPVSADAPAEVGAGSGSGGVLYLRICTCLASAKSKGVSPSATVGYGYR
ncbi:hypothetical protein Emed_006093 [Eimeria media]